MYLVNSLIGASVLSLTLTYLMQVYSALQRRNALARDLDMLSAQTGDAAELLAGIAPQRQFQSGYTHLATLAAAMTSYRAAVDRLRQADIATVDDATGVARYVALRARWDAHSGALASMLGYTLAEIDVAGAQPEQEPRRPPFRLRRHSFA